MLVPLSMMMHEPYWSLNHKVTFDGPNKLIRVNVGITELDVERDIYSAWKEWWIFLPDTQKWDAAMRSTGGDPKPGPDLGATFFLINGWRIKPWKGYYTLNITGNIFTEEGESPAVNPDFPSGAVLIYNVSNLIDQIENQADLLAEAVINADISGAAEGTFGAAMREVRESGVAAVGNILSGSTTLIVKTDITNADGYYDGMKIHVVSGVDSITRRVDGYLNSEGSFILDEDMPFAPAAGGKVYVVSDHSARLGRLG